MNIQLRDQRSLVELEAFGINEGKKSLLTVVRGSDSCTRFTAKYTMSLKGKILKIAQQISEISIATC